MKQKKNIIHPNFIVGLISYILLLGGAVLYYPEGIGAYLIIAAFVLGAIHYFKSLWDVWHDGEFKNGDGQKYFWFVSVMLIPPLGGMWYYMINDKRLSSEMSV